MTLALPEIQRTREKPGPGPVPGRPPPCARPPHRETHRRARRRRAPRNAARPRLRARPGEAVRGRRRRAPHRLERHRAPERAARAGGRRRARRHQWLVLDVSPSMGFGTGQRRKADVVEGVALALAHLTSRRGNRVGALTFGGSTPVTVPQRQGRGGLLGALVAARQEPETEQVGATSLGAALDRASAVARQRGVVFVVSDFLGPRDWRTPLLRLASRHEVTAIEIRDRREQELPDVGHLWLVDPETGRRIAVDTRRAKTRTAFAAAAEADRAEIARELASLGDRALHAGDRRGLAAHARRLPRDEEEAAMSFAWPLALLSLALVPAARARVPPRPAAACEVRDAVHEPRPARERRRPLARLAAAPAARALPCWRSSRCSSRSHGPRRRSPCRVTRRASSWRSTSPAR